jgi:hypothetical protein
MQIYVTTNQSPGDVFTLDADKLLPVKGKMEILTGK